MQSDNVFAFYDNFTPWKEEENRKEMKKLSQFLKVHISETTGTM